MGSLDRSRQGEDVGVGLAHVGGLVQAVDGLKGCAGLVKKRRLAAGSIGWQEVVDRPVRVRVQLQDLSKDMRRPAGLLAMREGQWASSIAENANALVKCASIDRRPLERQERMQ